MSPGWRDDRPRIHIWPLPDDRWNISFGPTGVRSKQDFESVGAAVSGAGMHAGGFGRGAVIIVETSNG